MLKTRIKYRKIISNLQFLIILNELIKYLYWFCKIWRKTLANFWPLEFLSQNHFNKLFNASINYIYVDQERPGEGLAKCQRYFIRLCCKLVIEGDSKILKIMSTLFMNAPILFSISCYWDKVIRIFRSNSCADFSLKTILIIEHFK